jgi:hypothetical protein
VIWTLVKRLLREGFRAHASHAGYESAEVGVLASWIGLALELLDAAAASRGPNDQLPSVH